MAFSDSEARRAFRVMKDSGRRPAHHPIRKQPLPAQPASGRPCSSIGRADDCIFQVAGSSPVGADLIKKEDF